MCCRRAEDTADEEAGQAGARLDLLQAAFRQVEVPLEASLKVASQADFAALLEEPALQSASWFLQRMRQRARFTMEASLESLAADLEVTGFQSWERLYETLAGQLEFEIPGPEGTSRRFPMSLKISMLEDPDPEVRRAVLEGSNRAWSQVGDVAAACLNCVAGHRLTLQARRGIRHFLDEAAFDSALERRTLDSLLGAIGRAGRSLAGICAARPACWVESLGFEPVGPLPLPSRRGSPGRPAAPGSFRLSGFDPEMADFAQMALEQGWVGSTAPRQGGRLLYTPIPLRQSRIFMTFQEQMGDVSTGSRARPRLARVGGSGPAPLDAGLSDDPDRDGLDLRRAGPGRFTLEDPSADERSQRVLLDRRLEAATTSLNIPMLPFRSRLHEERARGELTVSRLKELSTQARARSMGGPGPGPVGPWFWALKGHFYFTSTSSTTSPTPSAICSTWESTLGPPRRSGLPAAL